jgi:cystathionine beta-lyase/cystathionine gamma-synthase
VIAGDDLYGGTRRLMAKVFNRLGIETTFVDLTDLANLDAALQKNTKLVWIETPTNPMLKLIDIGALAQKTKAAGLILAVDNTFATPYLQKPLEFGADLVVHSTTKYLGGHSDVVGGAVITNNQAWAEQLAFIQNAVGAVPGPMDCFLVLRGIKTLAVRMEKHCSNALIIKDFLENHARVQRVWYPKGELIKRQMKHPGAMMSFVLEGGLEAAKHIIESLRLFKCAESLGGVESLASLPAMMTHASIPLEVRKGLGIEDGLIRLSVGIEDPIDLLKDLGDAFGPN